MNEFESCFLLVSFYYLGVIPGQWHSFTIMTVCYKMLILGRGRRLKYQEFKETLEPLKNPREFKNMQFWVEVLAPIKMHEAV